MRFISEGRKILFLLCAILLIAFSSVACTNKNTTDNTTKSNSESTDKPKSDQGQTVPTNKNNPIVTIEMEDGSKIKAELYPDVAPNTVNNFISLINKGFYDGLIFHRVIPGFMIQGGDPKGTGIGGPGYSIKGEFSANGFTKNTLKHERGVLSMARSQQMDSAGSQFFIMVNTATHLDGQYAAFGKVVEGMDVVDKIVASERDEKDKPKKDQKMKKVTVDTKGVTYPEPEKVK